MRDTGSCAVVVCSSEGSSVCAGSYEGGKYYVVDLDGECCAEWGYGVVAASDGKDGAVAYCYR